jgi:arylsulfatase A-like enzyme
LAIDPANVIVPPYYPDVAEVRKDIAVHLSNVVEMDRQAGKIIQELKDAGLYENTIIFFYSDHGDGLPYVKREITKRGLHIPLIIKFPKQQNAGKEDNRLISEIDFGPTALSLAGVTVPKYMHGKPFLGTQEVATPHKYIFAARDRMDEKTDRVRSVFDGRYQYLKNDLPELPFYQDLAYRKQQPGMVKILELRDAGKLSPTVLRWFKAKPNEELYDTQIDPYQLNNLLTDPKYKTKVTELKSQLINWRKEVGDLNVIDEKQLVTKWWGGADKAPITATPELIKSNNGYVIKCTTAGASIGYILKPKNGKSKISDSWKVYQDETIALNEGDEIDIKAQRIGYDSSDLKYTVPSIN